MSKWLNELSCFGYESFLPPITHCVKKEIRVPLKIRVLPVEIFPNFGLRKFCFGISIVETYYRLSSTKVDAQDKLNGVCSPDLADFHDLYISSDDKLFFLNLNLPKP